jgi:putative membrane protein
VLIVWQKALHLISVIVWFAGLFYMFRLFAYHTENADKPEVVEVLKTMENRLYRAIITPSLIATFFLGLWMIADNPGYLSKGWFRVKLVLVFGLAGYHGYMGRVRRRYSADDVYLTSAQCRIRKEIPTLFLIAIVLVAVLRPVS